MKLKDILSITSEMTFVNVVDYESNKVISRYDGKDSINVKLNEREIIRQYVRSDELYIVIL